MFNRFRSYLGPRKASAPSYPRVELFYWQSPSGVPNFGDDLSRVVVSLQLAARGYTLDDEAPSSTQLLAIGSVLHFAKTNATVWGSGVNGKIPEAVHRFHTLDVRAVRGPLTAEFLRSRGISVPDIYGDPALLLPVLVRNRVAKGSRSGTIFVPNLNDEMSSSYSLPSTIRQVSPMQGWNRCVAAITASEMVLASSLHGLVIAEAYGIPARYVRLTEEENIFKYKDYYLGTGREKIEFARSIDEAIEMGGAPPPELELSKLADAFPFDLWDI